MPYKHVAIFAEIFDAPKTISYFAGWSSPGEDDYVWFNSPLEIGELGVVGLVLHGGCYSSFPDEHVTFELRLERTQRQKMVSLGRIDWLSRKGGHSNQRKHGCPGEWAGQRVSNSHLHGFRENYQLSGKMKKALPCAVPLPFDPATYAELKALTGQIFKINDMGLVADPPWDYNLFP